MDINIFLISFGFIFILYEVFVSYNTITGNAAHCYSPPSIAIATAYLFWNFCMLFTPYRNVFLCLFFLSFFTIIVLWPYRENIAKLVKNEIVLDVPVPHWYKFYVTCKVFDSILSIVIISAGIKQALDIFYM